MTESLFQTPPKHPLPAALPASACFPFLLPSSDFPFYTGLDATDHDMATAWNGSC